MIVVGDFAGYDITISLLFERLEIDWQDWNGKVVCLKPNLVSHLPNPMVTDVGLIAAVGREISKRCKDVNIVVIEGSPFSTTTRFHQHQYTTLPYNLIDIDTCNLYYESVIEDMVFPKVHLPMILKDAKFVSCAPMKEHQECTVTLTVKNVIGLPPTAMYSKDGTWKNKLHDIGINEVITALNKHKPIDLAVLDGSIGGRGNNVTGTPCNPPIGRIIIGDDAYAVDYHGAALLGHDPTGIAHLNPK